MVTLPFGGVGKSTFLSLFVMFIIENQIFYSYPEQAPVERVPIMVTPAFKHFLTRNRVCSEVRDLNVSLISAIHRMKSETYL